MGYKIKLDKIHWIGIVVGLGAASTSFLFKEFLFFILVISAIIVSLPFLISFLIYQRNQKEKEEMFLAFSRDLVENVKSGTPIGRSIHNLNNRNYGTLSPHVRKLSSQITLGIPLSNALETFASDTESKVTARSVGLISEAEKAGGKIETVLESVANSVNQIEVLKKERKASVANLVTQGYLIFLVFIIIMLVLEYKILPLVTDLSIPSGETGLNVGIGQRGGIENFSAPLFIMILIQSFFAGLVIGKISEGSIKQGYKHSFILLSLTLLITTGARAVWGE